MRSNRIDEALYGKKYQGFQSNSEQEVAVAGNPANCSIVDKPRQQSVTLQITNPSNIFDSVGYLHNLACEYYMSTNSPADTSVEIIIKAMSRFLTQEFGFSNVEERVREKFKLVIDLVSKSNSPDFSIVNHNRSENAIVLRQTDLTFLNEVLNKLSVYLSKVNSNDDFQLAIDDVKRDESLVINDPGLNIDQKFLMLASTSVMRYSASLWFRIGSDTSNPWLPPSTVGRLDPTIFAADVVGAYTANQVSLTATGAAIGSSFFGIGAAAGYLGTMAAVGAGASMFRAWG